MADPERGMVAELLSRNAVDPKALAELRRELAAGRVAGPLHQALRERGLITPELEQELAGYISAHMHIGRFTVTRKLGSGAMGDVYAATDADNEGRLVAIKIVNQRYASDDSFIKRFVREVSALAGIEHENVATAIEHGLHLDRHFLVMELVDGPSIQELLDENGPLPEGYVLRIVRQVLDGLSYIYLRTKLVHRDIKPGNILAVPPQGQETADLFSRVDRAKIIDFGLARNYSGEGERLTLTGVTLGTPHYMSPEQIRGNDALDCRSDVYALGATVFHMLTGRTPYVGSSPGAVMTAHITERVPDPSELVPSLAKETRSLVQMAMAKEPNDRFQSLVAMTEACDRAIEACNSADRAGPRLLRKPLIVPPPTPRGPTKAPVVIPPPPGPDPTAETTVPPPPPDPHAATVTGLPPLVAPASGMPPAPSVTPTASATMAAMPPPPRATAAGSSAGRPRVQAAPSPAPAAPAVAASDPTPSVGSRRRAPSEPPAQPSDEAPATAPLEPLPLRRRSPPLGLVPWLALSVSVLLLAVALLWRLSNQVG